MVIKKCSKPDCEKPEKELNEDNYKILYYINDIPTWKAICKECMRKYARKHAAEHREENRARDNKRHKENPEYKRQWKIANKEKINAQEKERTQNDPMFKLKKMCRRSILHALKKVGASKNGESTIKYLLYTLEELKNHLEAQFEPWMNWQNHGNYNRKTWDDNNQLTWTWQIDHIIPQADLPYKTMGEDNFKKCWALNNLRPYSAKQNVIDGATKIRHKKVA